MLLGLKSILCWRFLQTVCSRIRPRSLLKRRICMYKLTERRFLNSYSNQRIKPATAINIHLTINPADPFPESILRISRSLVKEVEIKTHVTMRSWQVRMHTLASFSSHRRTPSDHTEMISLECTHWMPMPRFGQQGPLWGEAGAALHQTQPITVMKKQKQENFIHQLTRSSANVGLQELA